MVKQGIFKMYELHEIVALKGCETIQLLLYLCHFNAIELMWVNIKEKVAKQHTTFMLNEVEKLTR
jgi:hypothetical protein